VVLLELLATNLRRGHWRVAIRRFLMLVACGVDVPDAHKGVCEALLGTCPPRDLRRIRDGVQSWVVGDSLGMVLQGHASTVPVTLEQMIYHTRCVARGNGTAWVIGDLPFGSYQASPEQALNGAEALMQAGAQMVKLEGGGWTTETVRFLTQRGIPVCAHLGLTPQSVHALGGWRVQGRDDEAAATLRQHAAALADAGAAMLVLELVPSTLGAAITRELSIPVIGIGAGPDCSGQVLVMHDMLGLVPGQPPRFVRNFMTGSSGIEDAVRRYVDAVKDGSFPDPALHGY
jgi:3-methyl-2-oxobutanoate hydroxymethyltransferase